MNINFVSMVMLDVADLLNQMGNVEGKVYTINDHYFSFESVGIRYKLANSFMELLQLRTELEKMHDVGTHIKLKLKNE